MRAILFSVLASMTAGVFAQAVTEVQGRDSTYVRRSLLMHEDGSVVVGELPNPSAHNPNLGAMETSNGGTAYFDDNVANASFQVTTGASRLVRFTIGGDTATTVTFYDDGDGTCSSNQRTPTHTSPSATIPGIYEVGMDFTAGICMLTAGGAGAAEVGVVTLP